MGSGVQTTGLFSTAGRGLFYRDAVNAVTTNDKVALRNLVVDIVGTSVCAGELVAIVTDDDDCIQALNDAIDEGRFEISRKVTVGRSDHDGFKDALSGKYSVVVIHATGAQLRCDDVRKWFSNRAESIADGACVVLAVESDDDAAARALATGIVYDISSSNPLTLTALEDWRRRITRMHELTFKSRLTDVLVATTRREHAA